MIHLQEHVASIVRQRHFVFALEGLAPRICLVIPGTITRITDEVGQSFFCGLDFLEEANPIKFEFLAHGS
jgi:hypothetical protein